MTQRNLIQTLIFSLLLLGAGAAHAAANVDTPPVETPPVTTP